MAGRAGVDGLLTLGEAAAHPPGARQRAAAEMEGLAGGSGMGGRRAHVAEVDARRGFPKPGRSVIPVDAASHGDRAGTPGRVGRGMPRGGDQPAVTCRCHAVVGR